MIRQGVSDKKTKVPIRISGAKVKETKVGTMETTTKRVNMSKIGNYNRDNNINGMTMVIGTTGLGFMFLIKIGNLLIEKIEVIWGVLRI